MRTLELERAPWVLCKWAQFESAMARPSPKRIRFSRVFLREWFAALAVHDKLAAYVKAGGGGPGWSAQLSADADRRCVVELITELRTKLQGEGWSEDFLPELERKAEKLYRLLELGADEVTEEDFLVEFPHQESPAVSRVEHQLPELVELRRRSEWVLRFAFRLMEALELGEGPRGGRLESQLENLVEQAGLNLEFTGVAQEQVAAGNWLAASSEALRCGEQAEAGLDKLQWPEDFLAALRERTSQQPDLQ